MNYKLSSLLVLIIIHLSQSVLAIENIKLEKDFYTGRHNAFRTEYNMYNGIVSFNNYSLMKLYDNEKLLGKPVFSVEVLENYNFRVLHLGDEIHTGSIDKADFKKIPLNFYTGIGTPQFTVFIKDIKDGIAESFNPETNKPLFFEIPKNEADANVDSRYIDKTSSEYKHYLKKHMDINKNKDQPRYKEMIDFANGVYQENLTRAIADYLLKSEDKYFLFLLASTYYVRTNKKNNLKTICSKYKTLEDPLFVRELDEVVFEIAKYLSQEKKYILSIGVWDGGFTGKFETHGGLKFKIVFKNVNEVIRIDEDFMPFDEIKMFLIKLINPCENKLKK